MTQMIPKTIHYCWFGGEPKPALVQKCIKSWRTHCPDYEIIEWNESNFDIHSNAFTDAAYHDKKWAFVADYVRAFILFQRGGVYLDTDMELLQPLDPFLHHVFFAGFEANDTIATSTIACVAGNEVIRLFYEFYRDMPPCERKEIPTSPVVLTGILKEKGLRLNGKTQFLSDHAIYQKEIFGPTDLRWVFGKYSSKSVGVHHFMNSWGSDPCSEERSRLSKLRVSMIGLARNTIGTGMLHTLGQRIPRGK